MNPKKQSLMKPFIIFSIVLFVIILITGSTAFILSMGQIVRTNKSDELTRMLETERIRLGAAISAEIAIVLQLASSPIVRKHMTDPQDPVLARIATEEIAAYRKAFPGFLFFWVSDKDMQFYSDDNEPFWLDADDPVNYWYNMTLYETETYNFNINYNPDLDQIKLWINAPVFDYQNNPVGMAGAGIELPEFADTVFSNIDGHMEMYYFVPDGTIYAARDVELVTSGANIRDVLQELDIDILAETKTLAPWERRTFDIQNGIVAIGSIPLLDWYCIGTIHYDLADIDTAMSALFIVMLVVILSIIVIFNVFISKFLVSLRKASESLAMVAKKREQVLIRDNEMLDRLNSLKDEFFQNMSHDFKTPLTVISTCIMNASDMLGFETEKDQIQLSLDNAQGEIMRMSRMVDGAMRYSSLQDNRQDMNQLDLALLLQEGADTYRALLERNGNMLSLNITKSIPQVYGNADLLLHVLSNLLSNANRHTRDGEISIEAAMDKSEDMVIVKISDNGSGIKEEMLPYVFERGVSDSGSGLGLSICRTAIEAHNGTIAIDSVYGQGTTVIFSLPVNKNHETEDLEDE